jgi:hypothetical protein
MVPRQQIYIARYNLKNLAGPLSIPNITEQGSSKTQPTSRRKCSFQAHRIMTMVQ